MKDYLDRPIKIMVCADGFVSILRTSKDRRLKAALPCYSTNTIEEALMLVSKVCVLRCCKHGGKTGTLIEPWAPNFPSGGESSVDNIHELSQIFEKVYKGDK